MTTTSHRYARLAQSPLRSAVRRIARLFSRANDDTPASSESSVTIDPHAPLRNTTGIPWWTERLWAGYTTLALDQLRALSTDPDYRASVRAGAFLQIARWHLASGDAEGAHEFAVLARVASGNMAPQREQPAVEIDALVALGRLEEASHVLERAIKRHPDNVHLRLRRANVTRDPAIWLETINEILVTAGLAPVASDGSGTFDSLTASTEMAQGGPLVSVVMPAFQSSMTISTAITSVLHQSWRDLELIIVDDASTDGTVDVAQQFAEQDARVKVIMQSDNRGTYAARNLGLTLAAGEFITVHDADDWSHPQKIERQVAPLITEPAHIATISDWVRVDNHFGLSWSMRPSTKLIHRNYSSLMVHRDLFNRIGVWDEVRGAADVEFVQRIQAVHGDKAIETCVPDVPLSFARRHASSLTGGSHIPARTRTEITGPRRLYVEGFHWWHRSPSFTHDLPYRNIGMRPFPTPDSLLPHPVEAPIDLLVIGDLRPDRLVTHELERLAHIIGEHRVVRFLDLPNIEKDLSPLATEALTFIQSRDAGFVRQEGHNTKSALVLGMANFIHVPDALPKIASGITTVVVEPEMLNLGDCKWQAFERSLNNLIHVFGKVALQPHDNSVRTEMLRYLTNADNHIFAVDAVSTLESNWIQSG